MNAFIVYRCWVLNADLKETFAHLWKRNERNQRVRPLRARTERQKFCLRLVVNNIKESASTFHAQGLIDIFVAVSKVKCCCESLSCFLRPVPNLRECGSRVPSRGQNYFSHQICLAPNNKKQWICRCLFKGCRTANICKSFLWWYSAEPANEFKTTAVLPYAKGLSEQLRRCLQQQGVRAVFKSETTLRSQYDRKTPSTRLNKMT